jgi:hypothetical protein
MRVKPLAAPVEVEPPRSGEDGTNCVACGTPDDAYIWVSERWRVRAMDRPTGLPMVLILECRSHLDLGDLPNLLAAELGVMTVRLERAIRSLDGVARVHVNRWGDGSAHLHLWFLARPYGRLQLRGTFLSLWDDILPVIPEQQWRENLAMVAAWLADFGGRAIAEPPHIQWESPSTIAYSPDANVNVNPAEDAGAAYPSAGWAAATTSTDPEADTRPAGPESGDTGADPKSAFTSTGPEPATSSGGRESGASGADAKVAYTSAGPEPARSGDDVEKARPGIDSPTAQPGTDWVLVRSGADPAVTHSGADPAITHSGADPAVTHSGADPAMTHSSADPVPARSGLGSEAAHSASGIQGAQSASGSQGAYSDSGSQAAHSVLGSEGTHAGLGSDIPNTDADEEIPGAEAHRPVVADGPGVGAGTAHSGMGTDIPGPRVG